MCQKKYARNVPEKMRDWSSIEFPPVHALEEWNLVAKTRIQAN